MARLREYESTRGAWFITFADMVTLLLTFFVLLFSMSSIDSAVIQSISSSVSRDMPKRDMNRGSITREVREVAQLLIDTGNVHLHEGRIKELLFPRDLLPPVIDKGTLDTSLRVVESGEGVAFVLGGELAFEGAGSRVSEAGRAILGSLGPLFELSGGAVRISAFYGGAAGPESSHDAPGDYDAAARRALAALGVFINRGLAPSMFSLSAYGADRGDLAPAAEVPGAGRLEILLKKGKAALQEKE